MFRKRYPQGSAFSFLLFPSLINNLSQRFQSSATFLQMIYGFGKCGTSIKELIKLAQNFSKENLKCGKKNEQQYLILNPQLFHLQKKRKNKEITLSKKQEPE